MLSKSTLLHGFNIFIDYLDYENIENILAQRLSRKESRENYPETESTPLG